MLNCKVFNESQSEIAHFSISHFTEKYSENGVMTLNITFPIAAWSDTSLDKWAVIVDSKIGKVQIFEEDEMIVEYSKYNQATSLKSDYSPLREPEAVLTFVRNM